MRFAVYVTNLELAGTEIATWLATAGLEMTDRSEAILDNSKERRSVLEPHSSLVDGSLRAE